MSLQQKQSAFFLAFLAIVFVSTNATVAIIASKGTSFLVFSTLSTLISGPLLLLISPKLKKAQLIKLLKDPWFISVIILKMLNDVAFYYAVIESRQIESTIIVYLYPIFNMLLGSFILSDRYRRLNNRDWMLVAIAFVSVILISPFSENSQVGNDIFLTAIVSAICSIYHVIMQAVADKHNLNSKEESSLRSYIFLGSGILHLMAIAIVYLLSRFDIETFSLRFDVSLTVLIGAVWIAFAVNSMFEVLWLKASRTYNAISLKSLFYLSPVLGAFYLSILGIDNIDETVIFCMTGVILSNLLLHFRNIANLPFIAFFFGAIFGSVVLQTASSNGILQSFYIQNELFMTLITFISIIGGFLLFRATELFQRTNKIFSELIVSLSKMENNAKDAASLKKNEVLIIKLVNVPDITAWSLNTDDERKFIARLRSEGVAENYFDYLQCRISGLSRSERFLMYALSLIAIPCTMAQAINSGNGLFIAALSVGLLSFLPVLVDELSTFRSASQYGGFLANRANWLFQQSSTNKKYVSPNSYDYYKASKVQNTVMSLLGLGICVAVWYLFYG